jgi:hypothetical protein
MQAATSPNPSSGLADAAGTVHEPAGHEARIVCLVPSITELLCDLGLSEQLVGRTDFCIHPRETVRTVPTGVSEVPRPPRDLLYLIWREPWMTVAPDTYISRTLALFTWHTQPKTAAEPYPRVDINAFAGKVERVLLSSEPYHFRECHLAEVITAVHGAEVSLIDGEMTAWYGSRAIQGLRYLAEYTHRR